MELKQLFLPILLLFTSCNLQQEQTLTDFSFPEIVAAKGYTVPTDSLKIPQNAFIRPQIVEVKDPKVLEISTNNRSIEKNRRIKILNSTICKIGQGRYTTPKVVPSIPQIKLAGIPNIIPAKEPISKDQNPDNFSSFGILQGLPDNRITCMIQDKNNNLWIGTPNGVSKYDGKNFTQYTVKEGLCSNDIAYILEDSENNIWFATSGGASKYDGQNFTNFTKNEGLCSNFVLSICEDKSGQIWLGTEGGECPN